MNDHLRDINTPQPTPVDQHAEEVLRTVGQRSMLIKLVAVAAAVASIAAILTIL